MAENIDLTKPLPRGAIPTSRAELAAATPHVPDLRIAVPPSFLMWPVQMDDWGNRARSISLQLGVPLESPVHGGRRIEHGHVLPRGLSSRKVARER